MATIQIPAPEITIADRGIGLNHPTYFIADIAANHDGDLDRAIDLIRLAAEAGAEAAKFQNFRAPKIVSDYGFKALGGQQSHQAAWSKSVYDVYDDASVIESNRFVKMGWEGLGEIWSTSYFEGYNKNIEANAYRPLSLSTFAIEHAWFGMEPSKFHLFQILYSHQYLPLSLLHIKNNDGFQTSSGRRNLQVMESHSLDFFFSACNFCY